MTFGKYLHLSSTLLVLSGFYAVLITESYIWPCLSGIAVTIVWGIKGERIAEILRVPRMIWNVLAVLIFLFLFYRRIKRWFLFFFFTGAFF